MGISPRPIQVNGEILIDFNTLWVTDAFPTARCMAATPVQGPNGSLRFTPVVADMLHSS